MEWLFQSAASSVAWPALSAPHAALKLALGYQLERSQWLSPGRLRELQARQLGMLVRHAASHVPYYRGKWGGVPAVESFAELPLLARRDLQGSYDGLKADRIPAEHGAAAEVRTSGSTGAPVRVLNTQLSELFWNAITLRDHLWHRRDLNGKLATIRHGVTDTRAAAWGKATDGVAQTGSAVGLGIQTDVDSQTAWLEREDPDYLLTFPSNAAELARTCLRRGIALGRLREVRTMGEALNPTTRALCREAWRARVIDMYSAEEVGYIALQCPDHEHYHVQSETVLVEILDARGQPCAPGEVGRVVVTDLHNFAMPLLRYELGDLAEVGPDCSCGRGLPVLTRILGRVRNTLLAADGKRYFPTFGTRSMPVLDVLRQHQFVQKSFALVEGRLVTARPLTAEEERALRQHVLSRLPGGFEVRFAYVEAIPRSASGKFEDFVSEIAA